MTSGRTPERKPGKAVERTPRAGLLYLTAALIVGFSKLRRAGRDSPP